MRGRFLATGAAAAALMVAGVFIGNVSGARAQTKVAPLDTGPAASAQPWKRYPGWPAADYSKYNTLGKLASAPAPKEPHKLTGPPSWLPTAPAAVRASHVT
jgi:hypothetical protein